MKLSEVLTKTKEHFSKLGFSSPALDAELLFSHALGWKRIDLYLNAEYPLTEPEVELCRSLVRRRQKGEPVAYILGTKSFYNIDLEVSPSVLIPRPETEHIVDEALAWIRENPKDEYWVLDLGAGSGCIGMAIAHEDRRVKVIGVESSALASEVWTKNAVKNSLQDRCFLVSKSVENLESSDFHDFGFEAFDILVANPPYISLSDEEIDKNVSLYEPKEALFADNEGLYCYQVWPLKIRLYAREHNISLWEIGHKQGRLVKQSFENFEIFEQIDLIKDYSSKDRVVKAKFKKNI